MQSLKKARVFKHLSLLLALFGVIVIAALTFGVFFARSRLNVVPYLIASGVASVHKAPFPDINMTALTGEQQKVITILKQEYAAQPPGTKYSEGVKEAWCADFVSWVFKEAGVPLSNPNSGSWRIPGTYTLREYYESQNRFKPSGSGYSPKIGDIMLYDYPSPFGQHTNIVIKNDNGIITTIGGNEPGGIRIVKHAAQEPAGFVGYGVF